MTSGVYNTAKGLILSNDLDLNGASLMSALVLQSYTFNAADSITAIWTSVVYGVAPPTISAVTTTAGVMDAADVVFTSVTTTATVAGILIYKAVTGPTDHIPVLYEDLAAAILPNGGNINHAWDNGANKIFSW